MRSLILSTLSVLATYSTRLAPAAPHLATVEIKAFQFAPDTVRVRAGTRVRWINRDEIEHTVTAGSPDKRDPSINAVLNGKGTTAEIAVDRPGTHVYFCDRHQFMRGTLTVTR